MKKNNLISIIGGAGHIGLPLAVKLTEKKFIVNIVDTNKKQIELIKKKIPPFKEKDLESRLSYAINKKRLLFSKELNSIKNSKFIIICVGTPISSKLKPNLNLFFNLIKKIKKFLNNKHHLIIRSSVIPGTCDKIYNLINVNCKNISYCPERIVEGLSLQELPIIPQIISGSNKTTIKEAKKIFKKITGDLIECSFIEAELSKIFSNMYRYINFAIPNEMYLISKKLNADFSKIREIMRFNYSRNNGLAKAGFVGGPCLMKDSMQMSYIFNKKNSLVNAAYETNENLPNEIIKNLQKQKNYKSKIVGVLGLTFKPDSDDTRGSLSLKLLKILKRKKFKYLYSDPYVKFNKNISEKKLIYKSDIIIIGTNHKQYINLKINKKKQLIDLSGYLK